MIIALLHRFMSLFRPAPKRQPRIFVDASSFNPDQNCDRSDAVLLLARDEEATITERIFQAMRQSQGVVVLDQGSRDSTPYLAAQAGAVVVIQEPGQSHEAALQKAMHLAHQISSKVQIVRG